jgi:SAM-dependent methyltransferase
MVRADVLRQLRLRSDTFTLEPEITCRLAQWGARIYEVPVSYSGRTYLEGKKIKAIDGFKVFGELFRCRWLDPQFTHHRGLYVLKSIARARKFNRWLLAACAPWLGARILEAGAGIGSLSTLLLGRSRLVLVDSEPMFTARLQEQFGQRGNVRVIQADLTRPEDAALWKDEAIDTVLCCGVLEHVGPDEAVLRSFRDALQPGGHCVVVVPAEMWLYNAMDRQQGHQRRYDAAELRQKMERAGFEIVFSRSVGKLGSLAWWLFGRVLRRRQVSPGWIIWADRLFPLTRLLDCCLPLAGMSLVMVGRRKETP